MEDEKEFRTITFTIVCDAEEAADWRDKAMEMLEELMHDKVHLLMSSIKDDTPSD